MKKTLPENIPEEKREELAEIKSLLLNKFKKIEMIILFGSYARGDFTIERGLFEGKKSDFDILVVAKDKDTRKMVSLLPYDNFFDKLSTSVQLIAEQAEILNRNLKEKQFFFSDIVKEGVVLYDSGNCKLAKPKKLNQEERKKLTEENFENWFGQATTSFKYSNIAISEKDLRKAAFELQQTVEICYTTIEIVFTQYKSHEHDLLILRKRVDKFDERLFDIFSMKTTEEKDMFEHLNYAYIGGRYKSEKEFPVTEQQLDYWQAETEKLLKLTEEICLSKIASFGK